LCGLLLLFLSGVAAVQAVDVDSPVVISNVAANDDRLVVTLLNTAPYPVDIDSWQLAAANERVTVPPGTVLGGFSGREVTLSRPEGESVFTLVLESATGETVQRLEDPVHAWVDGDIFSLHGVDRYRYIVVYSRTTDDGPVHGCYEVEQDGTGAYVVSQFVHGQEVFSDSFMVEQGARYLDHAPLNDVVITDTRSDNDGRTYYGRTLGSIFGANQDPEPTVTPTPTPEQTAPAWPTRTPTHVTTTSPVTSPTPIPTSDQTVPTPSPTPVPTASPVPTVTTTAPAATTPVVTTPEPTVTTPEPTVMVTPSAEPTLGTPSSGVPGKRYAAWQAPTRRANRELTGSSPIATITPGASRTRTIRSFARTYPRWAQSRI
jgi:hypothetical protein